MIFAILTLLSALSLAATAGWFSIVGFMAIYAGAPIPALIMGVVTEAAKLVTASWLYRNWQYADWKLKAPLIYFTIALMVATSIGVFGFLSKAHLEQGAGTIDNSAKIEQLNYQINREKSLIADNEKIIGQLDATVNSFLGKDRTDRSLAVRKSQEPQRKQLRNEIDAAQKRIDTLNSEKFTLESEVRKMQLEVGPIRYIAELFYGVEENASKNIEAAVRIFTLLIVSTLDPLAVILLIAANHTLMRLKNGKEEKTDTTSTGTTPGNKQAKDAIDDESSKRVSTTHTEERAVESVESPPKEIQEDQVRIPIQKESLEYSTEVVQEEPAVALPVIKNPSRSRVFAETDNEKITKEPTKSDTGVSNTVRDAHNSTFREILGYEPHFIPQKVMENTKPLEKKTTPSILSWLSEFKR